jgi:hypothetical protein
LTKDSATYLNSEKNVRELKQQLSEDDRVVVVELKSGDSLKTIPPKLFRANGVFIQISLLPEQPMLKSQIYRSSHRPGTGDPSWTPRENFMFLIQDPSKVKGNIQLVFTAFNFNSTRAPEELGTGLLNIKNIGTEHVEQKIQLNDTDNGNAAGEILVNVYLLDAIEAAHTVEQVVYEYERWKPIIGYGSTKEHFLDSDKGRWSDSTQAKWGHSLEGIVGKLDEASFRITKNWFAVGTESDIQGWTYATNFNYLDWWPEQAPSRFVRRRQWKRVLCEITRDSFSRTPINPLQTNASSIEKTQVSTIKSESQVPHRPNVPGFHREL